MNRLSHSWKKALLLGSATTALAVGMFASLQAAMADDNQPIETVVVTGTRFNTDSAPAKASLETTEPQTIINKSYIENFVQPQADYVTILAIVPSLTGGDISGVGLSDGGTKNTLRGMQDGMFTMQYDDIPFGDTNGPTHHNISYFPASTIGSAVVDRGPGQADNMGAATFGGTIKLFSDVLSDTPTAYADGGYGSFDTRFANVQGESGNLDVLGTQARALVNLQDMFSDGALSGQFVRTQNAEVKIEDQFATHWSFTLFGDYAYLKENLDDNNGLTPAQVAYFGKNFALQNSNPLLPTYGPYNYTTKQTDLEYFKVNGDITSSMHLTNNAYTYAYWNHTFSPNSQEQTQANIQNELAGLCANPSPADQCSQDEGVKIPSGSPDAGLYNTATDLLAYDKQNAYRVWGDILKVQQDFDFGWLTGDVKFGTWWEAQATHRFKYYFDANVCQDLNIDPFVQGRSYAATECGAIHGKNNIVPGLGAAKDDEYSDWTQYQPFAEFDLKPSDNLTITPGVKYVHWDHAVHAPVEQGNGCGIDLQCGTPPDPAVPGEDYTKSFITRDLLPFLTVNYKIDPSWSAYFEYAKGVYVPDISSFEQSGALGSQGPAPETTTNYQLGTVYYADQFTFDADVYYIPIDNFLNVVPCTGDPAESCFTNNGHGTYKGIEGEGTYAFDEMFGVDLHGLSVFANGALMSSKQGAGSVNPGGWEANAPNWTAAAGILYNSDQWKLSLIDKWVGPQFSDASDFKFYELQSYSDLNASITYQIGMFQLSVFVDNLLDTRPATLITEGGNTPETNPATSLDQYFYQAPRMFMANVKVTY